MNEQLGAAQHSTPSARIISGQGQQDANLGCVISTPLRIKVTAPQACVECYSAEGAQ